MLFRSHSNEIMSKVNENGHTGIAFFFFFQSRLLGKVKQVCKATTPLLAFGTSTGIPFPFPIMLPFSHL